MKRTLGLAIVLGMLSSSQAVADMLPHLRLGREAERSDFIVVGEYLGGGRIKVSEVIKGDPIKLIWQMVSTFCKT